MEKYFKMGELFTGKVSQSGSSISDDTGIIGKLYCPDVYAKFAAHAINSHDELVTMNKELLAALEAVANCGRGSSGRIILDEFDEQCLTSAIEKAKAAS